MKWKPPQGGLWEWGKAFLIAVAALLLIHAFVLRWVTVRSTSMYATLLPGDLVGVERWPAWTGLHRGDIVVFRDPVQDDRSSIRRQLLVKRIAGLPGDLVELRNGNLLVNGSPVPPAPGGTTLWSIRLKAGTDPAGMLTALGLPADFVLPGHTVIDLPLNPRLAALLKERPEVVDVQPRPRTIGKTNHLFPFSPNYQWSNANYGPLRIPAQGDTLQLTAFNLPLYDRLISRYEHNTMEVSKGELTINGSPATAYVVRQGYYFVLGDSRDNSADSRYWGFVPADHVVGRAGFILLNARSFCKPSTAGRLLKAL